MPPKSKTGGKKPMGKKKAMGKKGKKAKKNEGPQGAELAAMQKKEEVCPHFGLRAVQMQYALKYLFSVSYKLLVFLNFRLFNSAVYESL